MMSELH